MKGVAISDAQVEFGLSDFQRLPDLPSYEEVRSADELRNAAAVHRRLSRLDWSFTDDDTLMMTNDYFICPSFKHPEYSVYDIRNGSYGYNYQYLGNARDRPDLGKFQNFPVMESAIKRPSDTIIIGDGRGSGYPHGQHSYKLDPPKLSLSTGAIYFGNWSQPTIKLQHCPAEARHDGKANISFLDGHSSSLTLEELGYIADENGVVIANHPGGNNRLFTGTGCDDSFYSE